MKKFLSSLLLAIIVLSQVFTSSAFAQSTAPNVSPTTETQNSQYLAPNTNPDVPKNLHTWTQNVMIEVFSAAICQMAGVDLINPNQGCLGVDSKTGKIGYVKSSGGLLGVMALAIGATYTPPLHTGDYISYLGQNFGIAKGAYAQGFGFQSLNPLIRVWSIFRNLAYAFLIIVFIVIGIAIMLRVKIDPRTVMTIQNQIPKIITALILITFSFAIAGFLIDLMYLSIYLIYGLFAGLIPASTNLTPASIQGQTIFQTATDINFFSIAHNIGSSGKEQINEYLQVAGGAGSFGLNELSDALHAVNSNLGGWAHTSVLDTLYDAIGLIMGFRIGSQASQIADVTIFGFNLTGLPAGLIAGGAAYTMTELFLREVLPYLIIFGIVMIALIYTLFRTLFMLIIAFVSILLDVIFAPVWILGGLLPGNQTFGFSAWIRDIASNLAVFPAVYGVLLLILVVGGALTTGDTVSGLSKEGAFVPPLVGNPLSPGFLGSIVSLGLFLMIPNIAKMVKAAFKAPKIELGIGSELGAGRAVVAGFAGGAASRFFKRDQQGNAIGLGARWLSDRKGGLGRRVGRFMGWQMTEDIREKAERRANPSAFTPKSRELKIAGRSIFKMTPKNPAMPTKPTGGAATPDAGESTVEVTGDDTTTGTSTS